MNTRRYLTLMSRVLAVATLIGVGGQVGAQAPPQLVPGVDYTKPNYANSPIMRKFVDSLPQLGSAGANNLGNYLPVAQPMGTATPAGVPQDGDYYEIALVEYTQQMHSDLPGPCTTDALGTTTCGGITPATTKMRGYVQIYPPGTTPGTGAVALTEADGTTPLLYNGTQVFGYDKPRYMGPVIVSSQGRPTRIKFYNLLPLTANGGDLFIPADTSIMGAGMGPDNSMYTENRATIHLHGGDTPWISDGTPHQWITPAGEAGTLLTGVSQENVPDMPVPAGGSATLYWPNGQSSRLMFYHDHAYGITRLNVYAGEAAGYLLTDPNDPTLNSFATGGDIPLVIQDKGFVNDGTVPANFTPGVTGTVPLATTAMDPLWADPANAGVWGQSKGSLWFPHVYMPNQNPNDISGANMLGRWDYGPWFWPIFPVSDLLPQTSAVPEAFVDTPLINGAPYPYISVTPTTYRFRILNACNDRYLNLQLYEAAGSSVSGGGIIGGITLTSAGTGYTKAPLVTITPNDATGHGASAEAIFDPATKTITGIHLISVGSGYTAQPTVTISAAPGDTTGNSAAAAAALYVDANMTEVGMVPADPSAPIAFPDWWTVNNTPGMTPNILDNRSGGVPDPATMGPSIIHIGSEGGIAPQAVELKNTPIGYEQNKRSVTVLNTYEHTLFLGPAERADVMIDFSQFAGKTLILYNDAPAPLPAGDPRNDYFTADPDNTSQGGAPSTAPGFGPNTRTVMQIRVSGTPTNPLDLVALNAAVGTAFNNTVTADPLRAPIVAPGVYARISDTSLLPTAGGAGVGSVIVTSGGTRYRAVPTVAFVGGGGTGAAGTATVVGGVITGVTITNPGSGYTSAPLVSFYGGRPTTPAIAVSALQGAVPLLPKTIQELFDPLGRMNATLGVELPFTSAAIQTTIPYGYVDPPTEVFADGDTQLWKITHNGVDTHAIHFHLFNVQLVNRVGWDGAIKPPWPEEIGWKETIKMNPLEDVVVALRAKSPTVPFALPNNVRPIDPTSPLGSTIGFFGVDPAGNPYAVQNTTVNFGSEYVWHCHLLGHEENDMMRPMLLASAPASPTGLTATLTGAGVRKSVVLSWIDNSSNETGFVVQRATDSLFTQNVVTVATLGPNVTTFTNRIGNTNRTYYYRVYAFNTVGSQNYGAGVDAAYPTATATSANLLSAAGGVGVNLPPLAPASASVTATNVSAIRDRATVTWVNAVGNNQTSFTVQWSTNNFATIAGSVNLGANVSSYTTGLLLRSTNYYFRVRANNSAVPVGSSAWVNATPYPVLTP